MSDVKRICKDCNEEFVLTESEVAFYNSHDLELPKRCKSCIKKRKEARRKGREK